MLPKLKIKNITITLLLSHYYYHTITLLLSHYYYHTITLLLSHYHHHTITITRSLSHYHTITITLLLSHYYYHTITITLLLSHYHYHTVTITLLLPYHCYHTITAILLVCGTGPNGSPRHCGLCKYPPQPEESDHDSLSPDNEKVWLQMNSSSSSLEEYNAGDITTASTGTAATFSMNG